ncbi:MAG: PhoH family protein [Candidatus Cloacimonadota bacterium]|nr:MAG: PhoH family protein [Candidatus Cloacimonadota bacterium]
MTEKTYILQGFPLINFLGNNDKNLRVLQQRFSGRIVVRGEKLILIGEKKEVEKFESGLQILISMIEAGDIIDEISIGLAFEKESKKKKEEEPLSIKTPKKIIRPRTPGQIRYVDAIENKEIVICIGPSGTGKTYLAVAKAVQNLISKKYERIILVRPAVEAGENLGFLPGDFREKIDPYLRPLYDALIDMVSSDKLKKLYETQTVEIAPLAFMRGRTLNDAFIILDEAQNTTSVQMKMFLTRLGNGAKAVVTGDITQIDLPEKQSSGLVQIQKILEKVKSVQFIYLTKKDVVRRKLVQRIVEAYEKYSNEKQK